MSLIRLGKASSRAWPIQEPTSPALSRMTPPKFQPSECNFSRMPFAETRLIRLNDLKFRACEGYYSKAAQACTWPCSITQMDASDELDSVYEAFVHWADAIIVASPIRWGTASSLYFKMAARMH